MDQPEGRVARRFRLVFRLVGVHNGKPFTPHSCAYFAIGLVNVCYLAHTMLFTDGDLTKTAHFMILCYFYIGTLWTVVAKSDGIMRIAHECDRLVGLEGDHIQRVYDKFVEQEKNSTPTQGIQTITTIGCIITPYICVEPFIKAWAGNKQIEFPFTGSNENPKIFIAIYILQCSMMFIACSACIVIIQTLMGTTLYLVIKYKVLSFELSRLDIQMINNSIVYETDLYKTIQRCVQSHHHILRIFDEYRDICTYGFRYSYLGLLGAATLSRSLLSGDNPDVGTIPHITAELSYIGFFCYILNQLEKENDNLKHAVFAAEWLRMPKEALSSLRLIMERTEVRPYVILYRGGGPANLETFYKLLNGTCAYLIFGMVLDRAL